MGLTSSYGVTARTENIRPSLPDAPPFPPPPPRSARRTERARRLREEVYGPIRTATARYLPAGAAPQEALHDYGPLHIDYYELVLIDRPGAVLTLLVAADD